MELFSQITTGFLNLIGKGQQETPEQKKERIFKFLMANLKLPLEKRVEVEAEIANLANRFEYPVEEVHLFIYWMQKEVKANPENWTMNLRYGLKLARTYGRRSCMTLSKDDLLAGLK